MTQVQEPLSNTFLVTMYAQNKSHCLIMVIHAIILLSGKKNLQLILKVILRVVTNNLYFTVVTLNAVLLLLHLYLSTDVEYVEIAELCTALMDAEDS